MAADPALWPAFIEWAEWALSHWEIPVTRVPPCWHQHPVLVEELTAAWAAWQFAYAPGSSASAPFSWLAEWDRSVARMTTNTAGMTCADSGHGPRRGTRTSIPPPKTGADVRLMGLKRHPVTTLADPGRALPSGS